jgi:pimeloyl-ACP methyl ester carboxylesterase
MTVAERPAWVDGKLFPFESRFVDTFTDHQAVIVKGAGHFVPSDAPEQFAAAVLSWYTPRVP